MEVATATPPNGGVPPFHDHDVREWSTLNSLTGVLERARIETDHWAANTNNSSHKYGKVVDSRARTDADGALRQQARRQLEVFQSQVPGGQLQVIKTHSVSSSRWTNKRGADVNEGGEEFEGLQIPSNPLDLSFQKSKAIVGRSAARRPPSRIRNKEDSSPTRQQNLYNPQLSASTNLQRVTRLCHQIHENAVKQSFGKYTNRSSISDRLNLTKTIDTNENYNAKNESTKDITYSSNHTNLSRTKSSSSEDFLINLQKDKSSKSIEDLEDLEQLQTWRRSSKIRRSLQYPKQEKSSPNKPTDLPETSVSVRKITEDFEKGRRLSTALRGNSIDLQALDQILQSISSSSSDRNSIADEEIETSRTGAPKSKRNSFVTVESLQEIRGRLRRTSSPEKDIFKDIKEHEIDDGIVTEENLSKSEEKMIESSKMNSSQSRVKSYVYGMESILSKKPVTGTGSLESRSKLLNGTTNRSEDWYNRRKSYGFEPVQNQNEPMSSKKNIVESSTDSGICRSSEVIVVPSVIKNHHTDSEEYDSSSNSVKNRLSSIELNKDSNFGNVKKISSLFDSSTNKTNSFCVKKDQDLSTTRNKRTNKENDWRLNSGTTIKIPIVSNNQWDNEPEKEIKRHSIAVDETKYVSQIKNNNEARRTSLIINEKFSNAPITFDNGDSDFAAFNKKSKKVEFCKTEVHFAAESGKVNIVETDEKPPPTQNFRRRRRNSNSLNYLNDFNKNGLPILHFGENYAEKTLFANGNQQYPDDINSADENEANANFKTSIGVVTVNSNFNSIGGFDDDKRELSENESIKGILKNKMVKPKPYHLGENPMNFNVFGDENDIWNQPQKPLERDPPLWKSTVTVSSTLFDNKLRNSEENTSVLKNFDTNNQPDLIRDQLKRLTEYQNDFRRAETTERVRPFLSVAERIKNMEESQKGDGPKGYSTRVNIGDGQAIVVENSSLSDPNVYLEPTRKEAQDSKEYDPSEKISHSEEPVKIKAEIKNRKYSPIVLRKHPIAVKPTELKLANASENLSSPLLVGRSSNDNSVEHSQEKITKTLENEMIRKNTQCRTIDESKVLENNPKNTFVKNEKVLRQPKTSELAYFGVPVTPQNNKTKSDTFTNGMKSNSNVTKSSYLKKETNSITKQNSPIYENISPVPIKSDLKSTRQFDSCILDELTKAADEILQAVKDYSEEESRRNKEEEEPKVELSTITENKSWKHQEKVNKPVDRPCKSKLRNASSNSSLEASPKDTKSTHRYISNTKASADKIKPRTSGSESSGLKSTTKARRLQRASSREALLQSHGSSSEDLASNEVPLRKPRLVRKTKTTQLTISNGIEMSKKNTVSTNAKKKTETSSKAKVEERVPSALPEIRHKTAVSTIRSTGEKSIRDKSKQRGEDNKRKATQYKDFIKVSPTSASPMKNKRDTVTHRLATANIKKYRPEKR